MTCIVGFCTNEGVMIGGDSAGVNNRMGVTERADKKVFRRDQYVFGGCGSFRMLDIIQYQLAPSPYYDGQGDERKFLVVNFIPELREVLKANGLLYRENEVERFGNAAFLVGLNKRLFMIWDDLQVGEASCGWAAMGCGQDYALGALWAVSAVGVRMKPEDKILTALKAAAKLSGGVIEPFHIVKNY